MIEAMQSVTVSDAVQIAILYVAVYSVLRGAKGSRFGQALLGIFTVSVFVVLIRRIRISKLFEEAGKIY